MNLFISKIIFQLIAPLAISIWICLLAVIVLIRRKNAGAALMVFAAVFLWAGSMPVTSCFLVGRLEKQYPPVPVEQSPSADAVVVLGGAVGAVQPPRLEVDLGGTSDRVLHAARLYRAGKAQFVIASGGAIPFMGFPEKEAPAISGLLQEWGVPLYAIIIEACSRTTYENAVYTRKIIEKGNISKVLLVTSAMHMPRALATFRKAGVDAIPSPTDFNVVQRKGYTFFDFLPDAEALGGTTKAVREYLGIVYYRLRNWM